MTATYGLRIRSVLYLLDANVLIDANRDYYPIDRVPEFWDWLIAMGESEQLKVPLEIYEEVTEGNDASADWLKDNRNTLLLDEDACEELVKEVVANGYASDLSDGEIERIGSDQFLIAHALTDLGQRCIVSTEVSKPSKIRANRHVPDVCRDFDVPCLNTFRLIRELDFNTNWNTF